MKTTLAFDIYGTLVDPSNMASHLLHDVGNDAVEFSEMWRQKQLEYCFRRGLMQRYADFSVCTADALKVTCLHFLADISAERQMELMRLYQHLPPFDDALLALETLRNTFRLFAFSNGTAAQVDAVLTNAGLRDYFEGIVSVDEVRSFKPDPAVYAYARHATGAESSPLWLVSGNAWDIIGARNAGLEAAWVRRSDKNIYDAWGIEPTITVRSLTDLITVLTK
ncbi:MAG: haloacid dehalogenase type II [Methylotenera sp.]|uniref:haloacid dehalogenase type II n=1 Tax=Methylotenera sp. TaxID=2051956 RepID=UPI002488369F|nr:haloacid dehalogenase type II [Methylotenera sp.]MDI1309285.1 haloacid dehalogenase type II [Methylotenera sp.]